MKKLLTITFAVILFAPLALYAAETNQTGFDWMNKIIWPLLAFVLPILITWLVTWLGKKITDVNKRKLIFNIATLADEFVQATLVKWPDLTWLKLIDEKVLDEFIAQLKKQGWSNGNTEEVAIRALKAAYYRETGPGEKPDWVKEPKPAKAAKK